MARIEELEKQMLDIRGRIEIVKRIMRRCFWRRLDKAVVRAYERWQNLVMQYMKLEQEYLNLWRTS